jgi:hypothetical protein
MMYWLVTAMYPQFLITVDEQLEEKAITVRVGQAVNTVGLAGQRMGISGVSHNVDETIHEVKFANFSPFAVPNASNTGANCCWGTSRVWDKRILPLRIDIGGHCEYMFTCIHGCIKAKCTSISRLQVIIKKNDLYEVAEDA